MVSEYMVLHYTQI